MNESPSRTCTRSPPSCTSRCSVARSTCLGSDEIRERIEQARTATLGDDCPYEDAIHCAEFAAIIEPLAISDFATYRRVARVGRATPLGARERKSLWTVVEYMLEKLEARGESTFGFCATPWPTRSRRAARSTVPLRRGRREPGLYQRRAADAARAGARGWQRPHALRRRRPSASIAAPRRGPPRASRSVGAPTSSRSTTAPPTPSVGSPTRSSRGSRRRPPELLAAPGSGARVFASDTGEEGPHLVSWVLGLLEEGYEPRGNRRVLPQPSG